MKKVICSRCKSRPAVIFISKIVDGKTVPEGLCIKCAMEMNVGPIKQMLDSMGISEDDIESLDEQFDQIFSDAEEGESFEPGGSPTVPPFLQSLISSMQESMLPKDPRETPPQSSGGDAAASENSTEQKAKERCKDKKRKFLSLYCTDLTQKARNGEIDTIIGRDKELSRVVQILCRRSKNNPCLIGEPGVGKTAIAEGLALRIAKGEVPAKLANKEIFLLDLTALIAGTQFRGQFESRIKSLIDEVKENGNIILFIDEVHNLVGAGDAEGSMNAANILKPALSRGVIQVVGATTFTEYRKYIEKDSALERRFQPVKIDEPSIDDAAEILIGIKGFYETFHRVRISDSLVRKAVILSERYITDRFLPDKAIDLLDEACTCANLRNKAISDLEISERQLEELRAREEELIGEAEPDYAAIATIKSDIVKCESDIETHRAGASDNAVTEADLAKVIELWTGIPSSKIIESDLKKLADLENVLKTKIIGQDEAIKVIASAVKRSRVQVSARRRPASFIFVGPTGVGKTELVKQLSAELFSTPETLIRLDMSEYMEKHSVSKIIGSPPGYVGYDEAGQLTEKVRRKPYSVILFDEIEKAHPDVLNILLQILDEGRITDAQGRTVNFENTIIVMTSNAGSERRGNSIGFGKETADLTRDKVMKALSEFLRPEFLGRVDEIAVFNNLTQENYEKIAELLLSELKQALSDKPLELKWTQDVPSYLAGKAIGGTRGARDLCILIRREIEDKLANIIIETSDDPATAVAVEVVDGQLNFSWL